MKYLHKFDASSKVTMGPIRIIVAVTCLASTIYAQNVGATGVTGGTGFTGPQGFPGRPGVSGNSGRTGATGIAGRPGSVGFLGPSGRTGQRGLPGEGQTGATGYPGPAGFPGAKGPPGQPTFISESGAICVPGPKGPPGRRGRKGPIGPTGERGPPPTPTEVTDEFPFLTPNNGRPDPNICAFPSALKAEPFEDDEESFVYAVVALAVSVVSLGAMLAVIFFSISNLRALRKDITSMGTQQNVYVTENVKVPHYEDLKMETDKL